MAQVQQLLVSHSYFSGPIDKNIMNYDHAYHAGNFADCLKHALLVHVLAYYRSRLKPFVCIDAFGGQGLYDLTSLEASKTAEAENGFKRWLALENPCDLVMEFLTAQRRANGRQELDAGLYAGSPRLMITDQMQAERLIVVEKHPDIARNLFLHLKGRGRFRLRQEDGYEASLSHLPVPEKRAIVLLDPPFEEWDEFKRLSHCVVHGLKKQPNACIIAWYPIKDLERPMNFEQEFMEASPKNLRVHLDVFAQEGISRTGVMVSNPPHRLKQALIAAEEDFAMLGKMKPAVLSVTSTGLE